MSLSPLQMSSLIAHDAPLLSPLTPSESTWPIFQASPIESNFSYTNYYALPSSSSQSASSSSASRMLKTRSTTNSSSEAEQLCVPTHQLFDFAPASPQSSVEEPDNQKPLSISIKPQSSTSLKRSASPAPSATKKRAVAERMSTKDFIPPDVSGLSKREARLVKNRAAAFLSRQRKREEFETMEVRVLELEQENAKLLALTQQGTDGAPHPVELVSEIEQLRAQLAAAQAREQELSAELNAKTVSIKQEAPEPESFLFATPPRTSSLQPHKSAASLGLMVLLCALPSLLAMQTQSALPTTFSLPNSAPSNAGGNNFDLNSFFGASNSDYDWSRNSVFDFETDKSSASVAASSAIRKLEFSNVDLSGLDVSFDTSPAEDGKIRVRIHNPSASGISSRAASPAASSISSNSNSYVAGSAKPDSGLWHLSSPTPESDPGMTLSDHGSVSSPSLSSASIYSQGGILNDPFLGVGSSPVFSTLPQPSSSSYGYPNDLGPMDYGSPDYFATDYANSMSGIENTGKRRVRIALKSMPCAGGTEGGEWEVQIC
ncbi:hypothetical protein C8J56DRAFT_927996 [Mycena floridula]|nr:hypothetical protein C8J56DRAFT_927996 [Mycena floridula]